MRIAVVTDSTAYFSDEEIKSCDFTVVPLTITFGEENYPEGTKYTNNDFYSKLRKKSNDFPRSSQPAAGEFVSAYTRLLENHDHIVSIHLSSNLSGTVSSAQTAKELVDKNRITVVDSLSTAQGLAAMVINSCNLSSSGATLDDIIGNLNYMMQNTSIFFLIDTLDYLHRGGRIGGAAALFGNLLQIKPLLYLNAEGRVDILDKVRTSKKAEARLLQEAVEVVNKLGTDNVIINVVHADNLEKATQLEKNIKELLPGCYTKLGELGPVIGTHVGPGTIGFIITPSI